MDVLTLLKPALEMTSGLWRWTQRGWLSGVNVSVSLGDEPPGEWRSCTLAIANGKKATVRLFKIRSKRPKGMLFAPAEHPFSNVVLENQATTDLHVPWEVGREPASIQVKVFIKRPLTWRAFSRQRSIVLEFDAIALDNKRTEFSIRAKAPPALW